MVRLLFMRLALRWLTSAKFCAVVAISVLALSIAATIGRAEEQPVDFARDVAPILEKHCIRCHQPAQRQGDLSLATAHDMLAADYVVASKPDDSYLLDVVKPTPGERPMMPKEGAALADNEIALLRTWIEQGAVWPEGVIVAERSKADKDWWSLRPLSNVEPPILPAEDSNLHGVDWSANPIDRFVLTKLREQSLASSPPADRATLLRRATYDLTGLPPTPEELDAFLHDDSPNAYEHIVDRLLESPHYGERWGRHWLDVVRFGESRGFERNRITDNIWPFRDYVIRSFNDDKPFDQFMREHLAGDVIGRMQPEIEVATAFLVAGPYDDVGNADPVAAAQIRADTIDEIIRATSEAFLGMTVGCARCHNHKFDPITQRDYYALYATFASVQHAEREVATASARAQRTAKTKPLEDAKRSLTSSRDELKRKLDVRADNHEPEAVKSWTRPQHSHFETTETFAPVDARYVRLLIEGNDLESEASREVRIDEFEVWTDEVDSRNVALASTGARAEGAVARSAKDFKRVYNLEVVNDGKFDQRWFVGGDRLTITLPATERINRIIFSSDRLRLLAADSRQSTFVGDYRIEVSQDGDSWTEVANSYDRLPPSQIIKQRRLLKMVTTADEAKQLAAFNDQIAKLDKRLAAVPKLPSWWVGKFAKPAEQYHIYRGGDPQRKGDTVTAASLGVLNEVVAGYSLDDSAHEPDRRVALAEWLTRSDHPLTPRVLANRVWHYHFGRGIVDSPSDFGYMGSKPTHPELLDYLACELVARGWKLKPLHRMIVTSQTYRQASTWRKEPSRVDADNRMLWRFSPRRLSAEELRDTMLSVGGKLDTKMGGPGFRLYDYQNDNVSTFVPLDRHGPETYRRAVYHQNARSSKIDLVSDFDAPDCALAIARRSATTTPLQALTLLNHSFTLDMADACAKRLEREAPDDIDAQIKRAFVLAYGRTADRKELAETKRVAVKFGLRALCRALLNTNAMLYVR